MPNIQMTELENGLRVITDRVDNIHSVALGAWIGVGTRHENMAHNGVAHMVEHMMFKGTKTRSASDIAEEIENVGGHMNAYTSREITSYHMHVLQQDTNIALDVLSDMLQNSTMPDDEVQRERQVILQEIGMCTDTPDDLIFDKYYETAYPDQAVGAPILGTTQIIQNMERATLMDYVQRFYTPAQTVISASGAVDHDTFVKSVETLFSHMPPDTKKPHTKAEYKGGECRLDKDLEQAHIILGFQGVGRLDPDYYTTQALSTILGGGMSSRLFQEIREKRGLVYSIFSFHSALSDGGQFGVYAGTGPDSLAELVPVVCQEIMQFANTIDPREVSRAKAQMKASILMGRESMMSRADQQAKTLLLKNAVLDVEDIVENIETVDVAGLQRVAKRIFTSAPTLAGLGPLASLESYDVVAGTLKA